MHLRMTYTYFSKDLTPYALPASFTALSMNSMVIFLVGCSLKIEFMRAILAALLLASALVGHVYVTISKKSFYIMLNSIYRFLS